MWRKLWSGQCRYLTIQAYGVLDGSRFMLSGYSKIPKLNKMVVYEIDSIFATQPPQMTWDAWKSRVEMLGLKD